MSSTANVITDVTEALPYDRRSFKTRLAQTTAADESELIDS
jgi:hypothetical protein